MPYCITCGKKSYNPYCFQHKPRKPISQRGKHSKLWQGTRLKWLEINKAAYYNCYICGKLLTQGELTLDHVLPRSARPDLRYDLKNLKPCCFKCNSEKGSKH